MPNSKAPFEMDALRPFVSVTLHRIEIIDRKLLGSHAIIDDVSNKLEGLFDAFDIAGKNPYKISNREDDRAIIKSRDVDCSSGDDRICLAGIWYKRITAPSWLDANMGSKRVQDTINHILLLAIRFPYLAVLGTHDRTRELLSESLVQGYCGTRQLGFYAPVIDSEILEQVYVRGPTRFFSLAGLHAPVLTKPDRKNLTGRDLRKALDPFSDQTFTYSSVVSILPELKIERKPYHSFKDGNTTTGYAHYSFRVGINPEEKRVWTVQTTEFNHLIEEIRILFDSLNLPKDRAVIGDWAYLQDGFKFLSRPIPSSELGNAFNAFDFGLDLPPAVEPGNDIVVKSELERCRELWRAYGRLEVIKSGDTPDFRARLYFYEEPIVEFDVAPRIYPDGSVVLPPTNYQGIPPNNEYHDGVTCFDTIYAQDRNAVTIRYDSGHIVRGPRLFRLGWEDVLYESWKWLFRTQQKDCVYYANIEKPASGFTVKGIPDKTLPKGWEQNLGKKIGTPASLFEFVVAFAEDLFKPQSKQDWYLCCDDGPGEIADFIYFEPGTGRLYLIHVKAADSNDPTRSISVKAYEEVVSQALKNLRYLDLANLKRLLEKGQNLPIGKACFHGNTRKPAGNRDMILKALDEYKGRRLLDKRVIVFQPHVRKSVWESAQHSWQAGDKSTPGNQINRLLQLRTLLADAEITCRKIGAQFETWGEDDTATLPATKAN